MSIMGCLARRSMIRKVINPITPMMNRALTTSEPTKGKAVKETANSNPKRPTENIAVPAQSKLWVFGALAGSLRRIVAHTVANRPMGTLMKKTHCQPSGVRMPPTTGPNTMPPAAVT